MLAKPNREWLYAHLTAGDSECDVFELVVNRDKLPAVYQGKKLRRRCTHALVPIHEGVVHDKGFHQRGCLGGNVGIEILTAVRHGRTRHGRFEGTFVTDSRGASESLDQCLMESKDLSQRKVVDHLASRR